jgi:uncharacterized membrane protein YeaQ/YmgE (transglycosylase-associated protein family)
MLTKTRIMKKYFNVGSIISLVLLLAVIALIANGENALAFEWEQTGIVMKVISGVCFVGAVVYPLFAEKLTLSKNENLNTFLLVLIWGALMVLGFLFAGYWSTEFNNPYL